MLLAMLAGTAAAAPTARELSRLLGGYEKIATAEQLKELGPGTDRALIAFVNDARWPASQRLHALLALRLLPSVAAHDFLREFVEARRSAREGAQVVELAAALSALTPYADEAPLLLSFVAHPAAKARQAAASSLGAMQAHDALPVLQARLAAERDDSVRAALARAVQALRLY